MTYASDAAVHLRSTLAAPALAAVNRARVAASLTATTVEAFRDEAAAEILRRLRRRGIEAEDITRPTDLAPAEVAFTLTLLFEAATQRAATPPSAQLNAQVDLFDANAVAWRAEWEREIAAASPVDDRKGTGASFSWDRG